jgi:catechol-2,3-dioxygenase
MKSQFGHIQLHINTANLEFYRDLFTLLGWKVSPSSDNTLDVIDSNNVSLWFTSAPKQHQNDYDGPGVNHLAIHTETIADVDTVVDFLNQRKIPTLFGTPQHHPEFSGVDHTYYQVMFESPDKILLEVVYIGRK